MAAPVLARFRRVIASIPAGRVMTYGGVAAAAGSPGAARLTVRALYAYDGLPWQRVVGAGGRISLPGAEGLEQRMRLEAEGVRFRGKRIPLDRFGWPAAPLRRRTAHGSARGRTARARSPGRVRA